MTKLGACIIYVPDVVAAVEFYERAFGMERRFISPTNDYGELHGEAPLAFVLESLIKDNGVDFTPARKGDRPPPFEVVLIYDDVKSAQDRALKAGATLVSEPKLKPWGQTMAYVRDPNGVLVELCTPWSAPSPS